jgi:hypothetical protein
MHNVNMRMVIQKGGVGGRWQRGPVAIQIS